MKTNVAAVGLPWRCDWGSFSPSGSVRYRRCRPIRRPYYSSPARRSCRYRQPGNFDRLKCSDVPPTLHRNPRRRRLRRATRPFHHQGKPACSWSVLPTRSVSALRIQCSGQPLQNKLLRAAIDFHRKRNVNHSANNGRCTTLPRPAAGNPRPYIPRPSMFRNGCPRYVARHLPPARRPRIDRPHLNGTACCGLPMRRAPTKPPDRWRPGIRPATSPLDHARYSNRGPQPVFRCR